MNIRVSKTNRDKMNRAHNYIVYNYLICFGNDPKYQNQ